MLLAELLCEDTKDDIARLQPDTIVTVFHGTRMTEAIPMCVNGIDGRQVVGRHYPHWDQGETVNRGLFVSADLEVALSFGNTVLEFQVRGRDLYPQYPSPSSVRRWNRDTRSYYPDSFRPSVSDNLLRPGREPQALFRGVVPPSDILRVYDANYTLDAKYDQGRIGEYRMVLSRQEFLGWVKQHGKNKTGQYSSIRLTAPLVLPHEKIDGDEFARRLQAEYPHIDDDELGKILKMYLAPKPTTTYQHQVGKLGEPPFNISHTAAKYLLPRLLAHFGIERAPNKLPPRQRPEHLLGKV